MLNPSSQDFLGDAILSLDSRPVMTPGHFYTSSPRPCAKTSLGFYNENATSLYDDGNSDTEPSPSGISENTSSTSPMSEDEGSDEQQQGDQIQQSETTQKPLFLTDLFPISNNQSLDQNTLQQLLVNPHLLRQLNIASEALHAKKAQTQTSAAMLPPPPPQQPFYPNQMGFSQSNFGQPMPPPPMPHYFSVGAFPTPMQTPCHTPICGQSVPPRPVISSVTTVVPPSMSLAMVNKPPQQFPHCMPPPNWQPPPSQPNMMSPPPNNYQPMLNESHNTSEPCVPKSLPRQCLVCGDQKAGMHYGVMTCFACMDFFRRRVLSGIKNKRVRYPDTYCSNNYRCFITKDTRNNCKFCRFQKCLDVGMRHDCVRSTVNERRCQSTLPPVNQNINM